MSPNPTPTDLAPCPFCANAKFQRNTKAKGYHEKHRLQRAGKPSSNHLIRCTRCGAKGPLSHSVEEAEATWNERPDAAADLIAQQAAEIERLRAVLLQIGEMQPCHCARCAVMGEVARKAYRSEGAV